MFDFVLTEEQRRLREEVRDLVRWVPRRKAFGQTIHQFQGVSFQVAKASETAGDPGPMRYPWGEETGLFLIGGS